MTTPLSPPPTVLVKLGSIAVHTEEMLGPNGHAFDVGAIHHLLQDPEILAWRKEMDALALLPVQR